MTERGAFAISAALLCACVVFLGMWKPLITPDFWMKDGNLTSIIGGLGGGFCTIVAGWLALIVGKRSLDRIAEQIAIQREELGYLKEQLDLQREDIEHQRKQRELAEDEVISRALHAIHECRYRLLRLEAVVEVHLESAESLKIWERGDDDKLPVNPLPDLSELIAHEEMWRLPIEIRMLIAVMHSQIRLYNVSLKVALLQREVPIPDANEVLKRIQEAYGELDSYQSKISGASKAAKSQ